MELIINSFFEKNELGVYFIQIAHEYEQHIDYFKEFRLYQNYIRCLIYIIKNFALQDRNLYLKIQKILYSFKKKNVKFFSDNIEKYLSNISNMHASFNVEQLSEENNIDMPY